ncbi:MAG: response regulator transcription factor [Allosphingosinicella sp.]
MRKWIESLSPRQFEIMVLVARHLSSSEIGRLLGLSLSTVDSHVATALRKLGFANRREAALWMIESGFVRRSPDDEARSGDFRYGENPLSNLHELSTAGTAPNSRSPGEGRAGSPEGKGDGLPAPAVHLAMAWVVARFLLDGLYLILFFATMSAVALGANWIVFECEQSNIDPFVLLVLKAVSYMLVVLDAIGIVTITGLLTYRFVRATMKAGD